MGGGGAIGCPETSVTTTNRCVASQKNEDLVSWVLYVQQLMLNCTVSHRNSAIYQDVGRAFLFPVDISVLCHQPSCHNCNHIATIFGSQNSAAALEADKIARRKIRAVSVIFQHSGVTNNTHTSRELISI